MKRPATQNASRSPIDAMIARLESEKPVTIREPLCLALRTTDPARRVSVKAVEEILRCPEDLRQQAVEIVLHPDDVIGLDPDFEASPLDAATAREVLTKCLIDPHHAESQWNASISRRSAEWRKRLVKLIGKRSTDDLVVNAPQFGECWNLPPAFLAEDSIPSIDLTKTAPTQARWVHLAIRHGIPVDIVPGPDPKAPIAVIDAAKIRDAESARADYDGSHWIKAWSSTPRIPQKPFITDFHRPLVGRGRKPRMPAESIGWKPPIADPGAWPVLPLGSLDGTAYGARRGNGRALEWVTRPAAGGTWKTLPTGEVDRIQKTWLRSIRKDRAVADCEDAFGIPRRTWEGFEAGKAISFPSAYLIESRRAAGA